MREGVRYMVLNRRHKAGLFLVLIATGLSLLFEASAKQTAGVVLLGLAATWLFGSLSLRTLGIIACLLACASGLFIAAYPVEADWERYQITFREYAFAVSQLRVAIANASTLTWDKVFDPVSEARKRWPRYRDLDEALILKGLNDPQRFRAAFPDYGGLPQQIVIYDPQGQRGLLPLTGVVDALEKGYKLLKYDRQGPGPIKTVNIPESARKWERPQPEGSDWVDVTALFAFEKSDEDILREFKTKILRPQPSFSIKATVASNRTRVVEGGSLLFFGMLGSVFLIWKRRKAGTAKRPQNT